MPGPQSCRIVLMTGDNLLTLAAREKTEGRTNVAFTGDVEEVRTILNTLASKLTQETVGRILPLASKKFFQPNVRSTLYYSENVGSRIATEFDRELSILPADFTGREIIRVGIGPPTFLAKKGQRLTFSSRINYNIKATKIVLKHAPSFFGGGGSNTITGANTVSTGAPGAFFGSIAPSAGTGFFGSAGGPAGPTGVAGPTRAGTGILSPFLSTLPPPPPPPIREEVRCEGQHVFEVTWHATLTSAGNIKGAKVEKIEYKSTTWEEQT